MGEKCPELTKLSSELEILRIIECPVCHEVPFPPIYQCITGHNICKLCRPKLQECPICKSRFSDARNYSVEQMVLASMHNCTYKDDGCKIKGTGEVLGHHIKICQYRSFMCPGTGTRNSCLKTISIKLSEAREHFLETHGSQKAYSKRIFELEFTHIVEDHTKLKTDVAFYPGLIDLDGKTFLAQMYTRNDIFYWTIFCIGTEEEAASYHAEITFTSGMKNSIKIQWTVPVQPIVKSEQLRDGNEMKDVVIPYCNFSDFKKIAVRDDAISKYRFHTDYKILKGEW